VIPLTYAPMEAKPANEIPGGTGWQYEPKWDGFRCLAFRYADSVTLMSKSGKPLTRYFPEIVSALAPLPEGDFVLDGELVIAQGEALDFDLLLQRIHPAASRIEKLSVETPATLILFDILLDKGRPLVDQALATRRQALERFARAISRNPRIVLSPATTDSARVHRWFTGPRNGIDGVVAKRTDLPYQTGTRTGMVKVKHKWTVDCVVGGFRYASHGKLVGSLLLGLYNAAGKLDHVGFLSGIKTADKAALTRKLEKLIKPPGFTGSAPGGPSRWSTERSAEWQPLAPKLVVEVTYDHFSGGRFRHATSFVRWRPDKSPRQCKMTQVTAGDGREAE
jgi:ATP-dependent DNA ligase